MATLDIQKILDESTGEAREMFEERIAYALEQEDPQLLSRLMDMLALGPEFDLRSVVPAPVTTMTVGINRSMSELYKNAQARKCVPEEEEARKLLCMMMLESEASELGRADVVYIQQKAFGHGHRYQSIEQVLRAGRALGLSPFDKDMPSLHILEAQYGDAHCAHEPIRINGQPWLFQVKGKNISSVEREYRLMPVSAKKMFGSPSNVWIFSRPASWR
jgi:hypothetical protein